MTKTVIVIVAHSDDETLGAGGTLAKHNNNGDNVYAVSMTDGVSSREVAASSIASRWDAAKEAAKKIGFTWLTPGNFPDNAMDTVPLLEIIKFIEKIKKEVKPDIIYTHSSTDLNIDHQLVNKATLTAFRPQANEIYTEIRTMEIPSSTDYSSSENSKFSPNLFVNIKDTWHTKLKALQAYKEEMKESPNSRSYEGLENLAKLRGNQVGLSHAEAFKIIRKIER